MDDFELPDAQPTDIYRKLDIYVDTQWTYYSGCMKDHGLKTQIV
jgi:hypothetical protein